MKVLLIHKSKTPIPLTTMWESLGRLCDLEKVSFGEKEMKHYARALDQFQFDRYDRVLLDQNIQKIGPQYRALRAVPNLVFLEQDSYQEFVPRSRWFRRYEIVFRDIGRLRVIVSNRTSERAFQQAGIDCQYLPKCYDEKTISNERRPRDIEFGYIGRIKHVVYTDRRELLETVQGPLGMQLLKTPHGDTRAYNEMLNRVRFFISADVGMYEYMFKNFEAMAAGCVVFAKRQPEPEQQALGFEDMKNLVLYDSAPELLEKAKQLRADPALTDRIAQAGQALVESRHKMTQRTAEMFAMLHAPVGTAPPPATLNEKLRLLWIRGLRPG